MTLAAPLATPFYTGGGTSTLVPGRYDCALNGIPFMIDWEKTYYGVLRFSRQSVALLKPQQDISGSVSEASLNPEDFARRAAEGWHHGAGQAHHDRSDSDPFRFRTSKGVDVWTRGQISLLNDTASSLASANTNLLLAAAGTRLYTLDGTDIQYTTDLTTWHALTGVPATAGTGIASDGYTVYTTHAADGIYSTNTGTTSTSSFNTRAANGICGYAKGRLIVSNDNVLVNITGASTEKILLTHPNSAFRWVGVADGPGQIYAAGYAGDKSIVYRTAVEADGTDLATCVVAGELPDGEVIRSIQGYLGFLLVGTDSGLRLLSLDSAGDVNAMGKIIPTTSPVYALEPQNQYVWYGLTNYDTTTTGLGRADLGTFTDPLTPAYASDLLASGQGTIQSAATFLGARVFSVSGLGVFKTSANLVASGTLESGLVNYGLPDVKIAMTMDVRFSSLVGTVTAALAGDSGTFSPVGSSSTAGATSLITSVGQVGAVTFETRLTLTRATSTTGPTVTTWTLESQPAPGRGELIDVPLQLFEYNKRGDDPPVFMDVPAVYQQLLEMERAGRPITYQDAFGSQTVFMDDHEFLIDQRLKSNDGYQGVFVAHLRAPRTRS